MRLRQRLGRRRLVIVINYSHALVIESMLGMSMSKPSFDRFLVNCNTEKANQVENNRFTYAPHLMIIVLYLQRLCACTHAFMIIKSSHSITNSIMRLGEQP